MTPRIRRRRGGFSYVEVLVATLLIAAALVPALEALQTGILGAAVHRSEAIRQHRVAGRLEEVLARAFVELDAAAVAAGGGPTPYSDPVGTSDRRIVRIERYDGAAAELGNDPFTGADTGLLWVRVEIERSAVTLETLTAR